MRSNYSTGSAITEAPCCRIRDPSVGVASGTDVSATRPGDRAHEGESVYVGYEMWVRGLETAAGGIQAPLAAEVTQRLAHFGFIDQRTVRLRFGGTLLAMGRRAET